MTNVKKKQVRRTPFGRCYMVLYVKHRFDPENDSCILLGEDGTLRKELTKVVGTWTLICNPDTKPHKCDLFLEEVLGNIGTDAVDGASAKPVTASKIMSPEEIIDFFKAESFH